MSDVPPGAAADRATEDGGGVAAPVSPTPVLFYVAAGLCVLGIILGVLAITGSGPLRLGHALALFMGGFGLLKLQVALRAIRAVRRGESPDPRLSTASPLVFRTWLGFKFVVAALAFGICAWFIARPEACDRLLPR